jgi:hypothetical protein
MKNFAPGLIAGVGAVALFQWSQIAYRLRLFFGEYHGQRGVNHIGDGDFVLIYVTNAVLLAAAIFALRQLWGGNRGWRVISVAIAAVNLLGWITLFFMHQTGALVEYSEFIRHFKGGI